jgi:hypothetical protein
MTTTRRNLLNAAPRVESHPTTATVDGVTYPSIFHAILATPESFGPLTLQSVGESFTRWLYDHAKGDADRFADWRTKSDASSWETTNLWDLWDALESPNPDRYRFE